MHEHRRITFTRPGGAESSLTATPKYRMLRLAHPKLDAKTKVASVHDCESGRWVQCTFTEKSHTCCRLQLKTATSSSGTVVLAALMGSR